MIEEMKREIVQICKTEDWLTFPEIQNRLGGKSRGGGRLWFADFNIVLWDGLSEEFGDAFSQLKAEGEIVAEPVSIFHYLHTGARLNLPIAEGRPEGKRYKEPTWVPVAIRHESRLNNKTRKQFGLPPKGKRNG